MHQGQCGHRPPANMPQFQQEGRTSFSGGGRIATQTVLGRVNLNALALGKTYRCQAALLKINDPPPANLLASPLQMHRQHDQPRAKGATTQNAGPSFRPVIHNTDALQNKPDSAVVRMISRLEAADSSFSGSHTLGCMASIPAHPGRDVGLIGRRGGSGVKAHPLAAPTDRHPLPEAPAS